MMGIIGWIGGVVDSFADAIFTSLCKEERFLYLTRGMLKSLKLTIIGSIIGVVLGLLLAIAKMMKTDQNDKHTNFFVKKLKNLLSSFASSYIAIVRGTPAVVQLMVIYFIVFRRFLIDIPFLRLPDDWVAGIAFGINSAAYVAEIIRAGITAVDKGQMEAGRSLGLSKIKTMTFIVVPQAVKNVLPALGNEFIVLLKETSVAGYIGITDLTKGAEFIGSVTYNYIVPLLCSAYIYFIMTSILSKTMDSFERRLHKSD